MAGSAFFSACEAAFFSLNDLQRADLKGHKWKAGRLVHSLLENPQKLLVTIYIGNELVNIAISALATSLAYKVFGSFSVGIVVGIVTFFLLLFGEILPKTLALQHAQNFALAAAYPLQWFSVFVNIPQKTLVTIAESIIKKLKLNATGSETGSTMSEEELKTLIALGENIEGLDPEESRMIHNVIQFGETTVSEIMTPKIEMFTLRSNESLEEILPKIVANFYSRVPVYEKDGETILGTLFTKDLNRMKHLSNDNFSLKNILHPPMFVPESKKIKELLQEFKKMKRHLAIVLDEYGSVCGLVTMEDILEELVGEISSEMRREENPIKKTNSSHYELVATLTLSEFNEHFGSNLPEDEFDTIGGMVFGLFGRVPRFGESVTHENFRFVVEKMKGPRILKLNLTVLEPPPGDEEPETAETKLTQSEGVS